MDLPTALALLGMVTFAALTQSTAGFGFSLMLVPLLSLLIGPKDTVVTANVLSFVLDVALLSRLRHLVEWRLGSTLFAGALAGMPFGLLVLIWLSPAGLQVLIAVMVILFTLLLIRGVRLQDSGRAGDICAGIISGILNTSTSMSGPPVVLYLQGKEVPQLRFRATLTAYFGAISLIAVGLLSATGHFNRTVGTASILAIPALVAGGYVGNWLHYRVPERLFRRLIYGILFLSAFSALAGALTT
jgi:uncharacterized membrane protein YfcA